MRLNQIVNQKVIIAPLDWGLGHATRSLALAKMLVQQNNSIVLAGNLAAKKVFESGLNNFEFIEYNGYNIKYKKNLPLWASAGIDLIKALPLIISEEKNANKFVAKFNADLIISDHRLGFRSSKVPSIFLGHQLQVRLPFALRGLNILHKSIINKYQALFIPDIENVNLSGNLSKVSGINIKPQYVGFLSQFKNFESTFEKTIDVLFLLSGPEPQRSIFEQKIINFLAKHNHLKFVLVRGVAKGSNLSLSHFKNLTIHNFLSGEPLAHLIQSSKCVLGRGGYTSLMDFFTLGGIKLLIVPTPGQTEQEYLAKNLASQNLAVVQSQHEFNLDKMLKQAENILEIKRVENN